MNPPEDQPELDVDAAFARLTAGVRLKPPGLGWRLRLAFAPGSRLRRRVLIVTVCLVVLAAGALTLRAVDRPDPVPPPSDDSTPFLTALPAIERDAVSR
ncbi:hypothetical protein MTP10_04180 [Nonomuraea sp. 3-1Str]|uniref:hypothetical protein n=1 Tax=unclassified Nonomuraea TaxID=2593643 RepID=UPI0028655B9E|nr:hypothetical protein [Nonomuraea sp. 3-1Str]MDR8407931.1 hypothetical protein [Nonomuraea sp. 3-1Str]